MKKLYTFLIGIFAFLTLSANVLAAIDPPTGLAAGTTTYSTIQLIWSAPATGADGYRIVFKPGATAPTTITDGGFRDIGNTTNYTVTGLPTGRQYSFAVFTISGAMYSSTAATVTSSTSSYLGDVFINEQSGSYIIGQSSMESKGNPNEGGISGNTLFEPGGIYVVDGTNTYTEEKMIIADSKNNRVLIYANTPTTDKPTASIVLGQATMTTNGSGNGSSQLKDPAGIVVYNKTKLIVTDRGNHRVLIWNTFPTMNGQAADVVLGQAMFGVSMFNRGGATPQNNTLYSPTGITLRGDTLIVSDYDNHRVLIWYSVPTTNGKAADIVIGQANFTSNGTPAMNASNMGTLKYPTGIACTSDGKLVVASEFEHRVLIWNKIPTTNGKVANVRLGQAFDNTNTAPGFPTSSNISYPRGISVSNQISDRLAVATNGRIMIWNTFPTTNYQAADVVLNRADLTANNPSTFTNNNAAASSYNASRLGYISNIYWSGSGHLYVADTTGNAVKKFDNGDLPFIGPTMLTVTSTTNNTATLSWSGGTATKFRIVFNSGFYEPTDSSDVNNTKYFIVDNLTGNSTTITGLDCNSVYSFRIYGKKGTKFSTYPSTPAGAKGYTKDTGCKSMPMTDGYINSIATYGNIIYLAGDFTKVGNITRNGLAAIDGTTMQVTSWDPNLTKGGITPPTASARVIGVSPDGKYVYVGGSFDKIGSNTAVALAKIDATTGVSVTYPQTNDPSFGSISYMGVSPDGSVFVYGEFTTIGGVNIFGLAGIDPTGNVLTYLKPFQSSAEHGSNKIRSISVSDDGSKLYVGHGNTGITYHWFDGMMDVTYTRNGIAEIDISTGKPTAFDPYPDSRGVFGIIRKGKSLWFCGSFDKMGGFMGTDLRRRLVKYNCTTCDGTDWVLDATFAPTDKTNGPNSKQSVGEGGATIRDIWLNGTTLYLRGDLTNYGGIPRYGLAAINANDASLITSFTVGAGELDAGQYVKLIGSTTLKKLMGSNGQKYDAFMTRKPIPGYFLVDYSSTPVAASVDKIVDVSTMDQVYDFTSQTAVDILFPANTVNTKGRVTVERYTNKAVNVVGIDASQIYQSTYGFVIHRSDPANPDFTTAEVRFDLDELPNRGGVMPGQENTVRVYKRSNPGYGNFKNCGTVTYDNMTHELKIPVTSFSEFILTSTSAILPVQLINFKVKPFENKFVEASWITANEKDADYFIIERSKDGINFEKVNEIKANGNTGEESKYISKDNYPYSGVSYYRLVQVDKDKTTRYFEVLSVNLVGEVKPDFIAYPNPSRGKQLQLSFYQFSGQQVELKIIDLLKGTELYTTTLAVQENQASISLGNLSLSSGVYLVKVIDSNGKALVKKIIIE